MRLTLTALAALALAACGGETKPADPVTPETPAADAAKPAAHDMDAAMKSADATDDTSTVETPNGHTFHTFPAKVESVHLPTAPGNVWTVSIPDTAIAEVTEAKDETMPDGATHHVIKITPKGAGTMDVKFERRASADQAGPVTETRTITFMVH